MIISETEKMSKPVGVLPYFGKHTVRNVPINIVPMFIANNWLDEWLYFGLEHCNQTFGICIKDGHGKMYCTVDCHEIQSCL